MQSNEKENEEKKRLKSFFYIKEQLKVFIEFINLYESKKIKTKQDTESILRFFITISRDVEHVLIRDLNE